MLADERFINKKVSLSGFTHNTQLMFEILNLFRTTTALLGVQSITLKRTFTSSVKFIV